MAWNDHRWSPGPYGLASSGSMSRVNTSEMPSVCWLASVDVGIVPLPAPPHPVQHEAVLLLVRALDQPDPQALAGVGPDHAGVRVAVVARLAVRVRRFHLVRVRRPGN